MRTALFFATLAVASVAAAARRMPPPDPAIPVYFRDQPVTKALPFRPADYLPGEYSWEPYGRTGTFTIRGRLNREGFQFLSWGGGRRVEPAFVERLGLTAACVHYYDYADELELAKRGLQFCVRMTHWPSFIASDLDADSLQNVVREEVTPFADCYAWSMSLMNTERHASGSMPYSLACMSPRWRAFAEKELGFPLPPTNAITATPALVNRQTLGLGKVEGVYEPCAALKTLRWYYLDGNPVFLGNKIEMEAIKAISPGNVCWSEPVTESYGIARHHDAIADWTYSHETWRTLSNLRAQYGKVAAYGKPYVPTLAMYNHTRDVYVHDPKRINRKGKFKGQPAHVFPVRTLGELKAQCYLAIGAVAAHGLSFFAADQWQTPNEAVTEAETAAFGEFVRRTLRPAAEVLRDIPTVRAPVAVAQCTEVEYLGGAGWTPRVCADRVAEELAKAAVPFDRVHDAGFTVENLSQYKAVFLPYLRLITPEHLAVLKALPPSVELIVDAQCPKDLLPQATRFETKFDWKRYAERTGPAFRDWLKPRVSGWRGTLDATSDSDGELGSRTFLKNLGTAQYVVVVNDRREHSEGPLTRTFTNSWYRPYCKAQRITTRLTAKGRPAVYDLTTSKRVLYEVKDGRLVWTVDYGPGEGHVFCVYPKPIARVSASWRAACGIAGEARVDVKVFDADGRLVPGRQYVDVEVVDPQGRRRDESGGYMAQDGLVSVPVRLARGDDPSENWNVSVRERASGLSQDGRKSFVLVGEGTAARVCVAADEPEFVRLAAADLTNDVLKITHAALPLLVGETPRAGDVSIRTVPDGRWEAYAATVRDGVLELTGSDARGTMFAVYDFCERRLGVDPLWFWSGVAHPKTKTLAWDDVAFAQASPTVRFRGWFVNDEDMLTKWMPASGMRDYMDYPYYSNVVSHVVMEAVAEAMVRSRMNFTIPASFLNITRPAEAGIAEICARRGLYVSMHHIEPMGVSGFAFKDYWRRRGRDLVYSYLRHPAEVEEVWRAFAAEWAKLPNVIWQIGLRGTGDRAIWQDDPTMPKDDAGRAALINRAMARQVAILDELGVPKENRRVTTTLWGEGTYFNEKGLLKIPAGTTVVFADNNCGWKWGEDLVSARREPNRLTYGTYYHHQLILAGPHLVTLIPASKTCSMLREAMAHDTGEYAVFNIGNVREFIYGLDATAKMTWNLAAFDPAAWERDWLARRVPSAAADWQAARRAYFAALVENPANGIPCFLDGRMRCRVYEKNWAMQAILDGKVPRQRVEKPKPKTKDPFLSKIGQCVLRDVTPMQAYALLETQRVAYAEAAALARKAMAATAKGERTFANDHLLYPAELMLGFSEAYGEIILAEEALRESRDADCLRHLKSAEASLVRVVDLGKGYCHAPWETWYAGCEKVSPREMLRLTRETIARRE